MLKRFLTFMLMCVAVASGALPTGVASADIGDIAPISDFTLYGSPSNLYYTSQATHVYGTIYAYVEWRATVNDLYVVTVSAAEDGTSLTYTVDTLVIDANTDGREPRSLVEVGSGAGYTTYAFAYSDPFTVVTVDITNAGAITLNDSQALATVMYDTPIDMCNLGGGTKYAILFSYSNLKLWLYTWDIQTDGTIAATFTEQKEIYSNDFDYPQIISAGSTKYGLFGRKPSSQTGFAFLWDISDVGEIAASYTVRNTSFAPSAGAFNIVNIHDDYYASYKQYAMPYVGDDDGYVYTFQMTTTTISAIIDSWEFETFNASEPFGYVHSTNLDSSGVVMCVVQGYTAAYNKIFTHEISNVGIITKSFIDSETIDASATIRNTIPFVVDNTNGRTVCVVYSDQSYSNVEASTFDVEPYINPSNAFITTDDASDVTISTARLWAYVDSDDGSTVYVRFQYGPTTSYGTNTSWVGGYEEGDRVYVDIDSLSPGTTTHFRAQIYTPEYGTSYLRSGDDESFATESTMYKATNLSATPLSGTKVLLRWSKGKNAQSTIIKYKLTGYPTNYADGSTAYSGTASSYIVESLTSGVTYYFSAWSFTGTEYAVTEATEAVPNTTDAGTDSDTVIDAALYGEYDDYYVNDILTNITRNDSAVIADSTESSDEIELASAITSQTQGDSYYITFRCDAVATTLADLAAEELYVGPTDYTNDPSATQQTNSPFYPWASWVANVTGMSIAIAFVVICTLTTIGAGFLALAFSKSETLAAFIVGATLFYWQDSGVIATWVLILYALLACGYLFVVKGRVQGA